jgi:hypothetical protein
MAKRKVTHRTAPASAAGVLRVSEDRLSDAQASVAKAVKLDLDAIDTLNWALSEVIALLDLISEVYHVNLEDRTLDHAAKLGKGRLRQAQTAVDCIWEQARVLAGHEPTVQP